MRAAPAVRFRAKVAIDVETGCHLWTGALSDGYGRFRLYGRSSRAHRVAYEWQFGPVPTGMVLDHLCRNRACVNPFHLEVVTPEQNSNRGRFSRTVCHRGHPYTEASTYWYAGKRCCRICRAQMERERRAARALVRAA